jgi:hypothetical protein
MRRNVEMFAPAILLKKVLCMHSLQPLLYGAIVVRQLRGPDVGFSMQPRAHTLASTHDWAETCRWPSITPQAEPQLSEGSQFLTSNFPQIFQMTGHDRKQPIARDWIRFIQFFPLELSWPRAGCLGPRKALESCQVIMLMHSSTTAVQA